MRWGSITCALVSLVGCRQVLGIDEGVVGDASGIPEDIDVGIDADGMAMNGHDEDSDAIFDVNDNCPSTPNPSQAALEDPLGIACDPRSGTEGDRVGLFLPFYPMGQPSELQMSTVTYGTDYVDLDNQEIRTGTQYDATRVTTDVQLVSLPGTNASFEVAVGNRACRIAVCGSNVCLIAADGTMSNMVTITSTAFDATIALSQTAAQLECILARPSQSMLVVSVPETNASNERVRIKADKAVVRVKNLTVYVIETL